MRSIAPKTLAEIKSAFKSADYIFCIVLAYLAETDSSEFGLQGAQFKCIKCYHRGLSKSECHETLISNNEFTGSCNQAIGVVGRA